VYARAGEEARGAPALREPADQARLRDAMAALRALAVSYAGFVVSLGMFPQPAAAEARGALQLLDALAAAAGAAGGSAAASGPAGLAGGYVPPPAACAAGAAGAAPPLLVPVDVRAAAAVAPMPPGFWEDFCARFEGEEALAAVVGPAAEALRAALARVSALGEWAPLLAALERLLAPRAAAAAAAQLPLWLGADSADAPGRALEARSLLGAAFGVSAVPDIALSPLAPGTRLPDAADALFPAPDATSGADFRAAAASVGASLASLHGALHRLLLALLRAGDAPRAGALGWLAAALRRNAERTKMHPDWARAATDGFALNLAAVCLRLCEPFLDPASGKAWPRLDARHASDPAARFRALPDDTRLGAEAAEVAAWGAEHAPLGGYHFICEVFFAAAAALRLGPRKAAENLQELGRRASHYEEDAGAPDAPPGQAAAFRQAIARTRASALCLQASLGAGDLPAGALRFRRILAAWLLRLASPAAAAGGAPALPLPAATMEFRSLPEHLVEDLCESLIWATRVRPPGAPADPAAMQDLFLFFAVFLGAPDHVRSPFLRGRMLAALHAHLPAATEGAGGDGWRRGGRAAAAAGGAELAALLDGAHPLVAAALVRSLLALYVDVERTDRHNAFYEKFQTRREIGEVLAHLWAAPEHRAAWRAAAVGEPRLYVRFVNMLINDSQHLLQEALGLLPEAQAHERLRGDAAAWGALAPAARREAETAASRRRNTLRFDFQLAAACLHLMEMTSADAAIAVRFFDAQVRERQARILNFFLRYLTLPAERRRLRLAEPERHGWRPRELLASLAAIHLNLWRANPTEWAAAVAADTDYYGAAPAIFPELVSVLRGLGLAPEADAAALEALAGAAAAAAAAAAAEEERFDAPPDEFLDPLTCALMRDPVALPSGHVVDRATILQQLLTDARDPFSRAPLAEEDLAPAPELAARIGAWVAAQRAARRGGADGVDGGAGGGGAGGGGAADMDAE
jgi:ubiquitin conjugation factor E4 B